MAGSGDALGSAWSPVTPRDFCVAGVALGPSFHVAGVALGDINLRFECHTPSSTCKKMSEARLVAKNS